MQENIQVVAHAALAGERIDALRTLFDSEYFSEYGPWDPEQPYGYSPADVHVLAFTDSFLVGHVGFQRRTIVVGSARVAIAGTGGVIVHHDARGGGLGRRVMAHAQQAMVEDENVDFGYLGCREEVVPFYVRTGWNRIDATERHTSLTDPDEIIVSSGSPILIFPTRDLDWPSGDIDLIGTPW